MRKRLTWILAVGAAAGLLFAGVASAYKPAVIKVGNLVLTFNGGFSPTKLSKTKPTPISLNVSGKIETADHSHPPPITSFVLETDKNGSVNAKGLATCKQGQLEARTSVDAKKACAKALIGSGTTEVEVLFAESQPVHLKSQLLIFNGGVKGGTTTLFIHAYLSTPVAAAIVTTVKVTKIHNGRYGLKSVATIPKIAGYAGSVTNFNLTINKKFNYKGKQQSYLAAKCTNGTIVAQGEAIFKDGTKAKGGVVRPCTPTG
jgi:hypothetical protein